MPDASGRLRIGVIGCGLIARRAHLPAFAACERAEIVGLASGHVESAREAAAQFGDPPVFADWQELIAAPTIDAVDVCAPNALHAPMAIAAARAGKHVLVEKPMAVTLAEADAMIAAAREAGVTLMVAHNLRFQAAIATLKRLIHDGAIGRVLAARGIFMHGGPDEAWGATSDWFWREDAAGGGALIDLGVHMIDLLRWFVSRPVVDVIAMTSRMLKPTFADDNATVIMRFDDGVLASMITSWTARPFAQNQITILGELGHIAFDTRAAEPLVLHLRGDAGGRKVVPEIPTVSPLGNPYVHFVESVLDGKRPLTDGDEGRATLAVALAAYESAHSGRAVSPS